MSGRNRGTLDNCGKPGATRSIGAIGGLAPRFCPYNLNVKPHPFTEGETLNKMSDDDLTAIITHGGAALNKSALMPAWGDTLSKSDIQALISYIRAVADPPSRSAGPVLAKN